VSDPLLQTTALDVSVGGRVVCNGLNLSLRPGESWAVLGRNGTGKTTLLHTLAGLRHPESGEIRLAGTPIDQLPRRAVAQQLGLLTQESADLFPTRVLDTVLIGRHPHLPPLAWEGGAELAIATEVLAKVGLSGMEARDVRTLSGGERRRLSIATLLLQAPRVALLDEPANHLDVAHLVGLLGMLRERVKSDAGTQMMVLHDVNLALRYCDHALLLFGDGSTTSGPVDKVINADTLQHLYGHPLAAVVGPHGRAWLPS